MPSYSSMTLKELVGQGVLWSAAGDTVEGGARPHARSALSSSTLPFGVPRIDQELFGSGLSSHAVHEWFIAYEKGTTLCPPHTLLTHLLKQTVSRYVLWIGEEVWPAPYALEHSDLIQRAIFLRIHNRAEKLHAIETTLRSSATAAVVAYLDKATFALTQRFALATRLSGAWMFLLRPQADLKLKTLSRTKSAAMTRWLVKSSPSAKSDAPVWNVELLKQKGRYAQEQSWLLGALPWDGISADFSGGLRLIDQEAEFQAASELQTQGEDSRYRFQQAG